MQRPAHVQAEFVHQPRARTPVHIQRLALPSAAIQRDHQLLTETLLTGVSHDQFLEVGNDAPLSAGVQLRCDQVFPDSHQPLFELGGRGPAEQPLPGVQESGPPPHSRASFSTLPACSGASRSSSDPREASRRNRAASVASAGMSSR